MSKNLGRLSNQQMRSDCNISRCDYDVAVIGGGHAGAEAAWAAAKLGASVAMITLDPSRIGQMSCNPAIGGLAKGQMVREIDALGGLMGLATDATGIQFRMLNRSKGPAVWGPRAQADKYRYSAEVQRLLRTCDGLDLIGGEVAEIEVGVDRRVRSIVLGTGQRITCRAAIVTTGTFLRALMHTGEQQTEGGRVGEAAARGLSGCLEKLGLELGRLKTGTPPRLERDSIDFSAFETQAGDDAPIPFSYLNDYPADAGAAPWRPPLPQVNCWIGATNPEIHQIIRDNLHRAPMYSGQIQSTGPRYCPSIEDKVVRFAEKDRHQIFLEPEGLDTNEIYCNGISTSLPADVQEQIIRRVQGLQNAKVLKWGYAVEYDMVWPTQINSTLQTKKIAGLFLAGQINGTSGYEEAAAQGLVAGVNAVQYASGAEPSFVLGRDQAYIGVLVDDLVTKPPIEPYRMFTSRAEHRLYLRNDNADERLTPVGRSLGLVKDDRWNGYSARAESIAEGLNQLKTTRVGDVSAFDFLRRSESAWEQVADSFQIRPSIGNLLAIQAKYQGYIFRQQREIEKFSQLESKLIPSTIDYATIIGLRNEARQKFGKFTPRSLGQALRISGITPADVMVLSIHLERGRRS